MTILKNDDVIKKVTWPSLLFWYFLKDRMQYYISSKFQSQSLTGSGFMTGGGLFSVKKAQAG